jgi:hypothetical protein
MCAELERTARAQETALGFATANHLVARNLVLKG